MKHGEAVRLHIVYSNFPKRELTLELGHGHLAQMSQRCDYSWCLNAEVNRESCEADGRLDMGKPDGRVVPNGSGISLGPRAVHVITWKYGR